MNLKQILSLEDFMEKFECVENGSVWWKLGANPDKVKQYIHSHDKQVLEAEIEWLTDLRNLMNIEGRMIIAGKLSIHIDKITKALEEI